MYTHAMVTSRGACVVDWGPWMWENNPVAYMCRCITGMCGCIGCVLVVYKNAVRVNRLLYLFLFSTMMYG